jgi:hypothetical protein
MTERILTLGASYGSLLGMKLLMTGRDVTMVCLPAEAELINRDGVIVRLPVRGREGLVELNSKTMKGKVKAIGPDAADPADYDMIGMAMQEPQYRSPGVRELMARVAASRKPCMSIMNMPPPPYLARIPGVDISTLDHCYADMSVWDGFDPAKFTLASPDPQAFRPPEEPANVLQVGLPTNFKVAAFDAASDTARLRSMEADIDAIRYDPGDGPIELPVKLRVHDSIFVPLAKWAMLLTGNYRCVTPEGPRAIRDAVHSDVEASRAIYAWVSRVCVALGAAEGDMVPFEKYAKAAEGLLKPSSAARALYAGAPNIERVDLLVVALAEAIEPAPDAVRRGTELVTELLEKNRAKA